MVVFLDIDGTILPHGGAVSHKVWDYIEKAKANGHLIGIATGRAWSEVPEEFRHFDLMVCAAGGMVKYKNEIVHADYLGIQEIKDMVAIYDEANAIFILEGRDQNYMRKSLRDRLFKNVDSLDERQKHFFKIFNETTLYEDISEVKYIHKATYYYADYEEQWFKEKLSSIGMGVTQLSMLEAKGNSGEVTKNGITKGTAIEWTMNYLHLPMSECMAIGDSENDLPMIETAGHGIAMGNSCEVLKNVAEYVTDTVEMDGVCRAFEKYGLV